MKRIWSALLIIALFGLAVVGQSKGQVYYLAPNQFDEMQTTAAAAIEQFVEEAGYECTVVVAGNEDVALQINQLEDVITQNPVAIIVAACNAEAIAPSIETARAEGIPVIVYDRMISGTYIDFTSVAGCYKMGLLAGEEIVRLLTEKYGEPRGTVLDIMGDPGDMYTVLIEEGFQKYMEDYPNIEITTKVNHGWEATTGANIADDWLVANPDTDLVFPHADHMAAANASRFENLGYEAGEILHVSTGGFPMGLELIREGWLTSTVNYPVIGLARGVAVFLDQIVNRECIAPGTYEVGGLESELIYQDYGPELQLPPNIVTAQNVDDPTLWGNQVGK